MANSACERVGGRDGRSAPSWFPFPWRRVSGAVLTAFVLLNLAPFANADRREPKASSKRSATGGPHFLPLAFEENRGQHSDPGVVALARSDRYDVALRRDGSMVFAVRRAQGGFGVLRLDLVGARPSDARFGQPLPGRVNYFAGNDRATWRTGVLRFGEVTFPKVRKGVDLVYYGRGRRLEYDLVVQPGANPSRLALRASGADRLSLSPSGDLVLSSGGAELRLSRPVAYQTVDGERRDVAARFALRGAREVGFAVGVYDRSQPLVIDPVITCATYLGGAGDDAARAVAIGADGGIYVTGSTTSLDFPVTGSGAGKSPGYSVYVAKLAADATSLEYATYLGAASSWGPSGYAVAVNQDGQAHVVGRVHADFPEINPIPNQSGPAFLTKLGADGSLVYSTRISLSADDSRVALTPDGNAVVAGSQATGYNLPVKDALHAASRGGMETWVAKFDAGGTIVWATYLGGSRDDCNVGGVATDAAGNVYVGGSTTSRDFPVTAGVRQTVLSGHTAFAAAPGAATWTGLSLDPDVNGFATDANSVSVYAATMGGVFRSDDGGAKWIGLNTGLQGVNVTSIAVSRSDASVIYVGTDRGGVYRTVDGGATWNLASGMGLGGEVRAIAVHPGDPRTVLVAMNYRGVYKTIDSGASWTASETAFTSSDWMFSLAADPRISETPEACTIYLGSSSGVYKSTDCGSTWAKSDAGVATGWRREVAVDPNDPDRVFLGGVGNGYVSTDRGESWSPFGGAFGSWQVPTVVVPVPGAPDVLHAVFTGDYYTSSDAGITWTRVGASFNTYPSAMVYAAANGGTLIGAAPTPTDIFLTKIAADGQSLVYSTYIGGPGGAGEHLFDLEVNAGGEAVLAGRASAGFPITRDNGFDWTTAGPWSYPLLAKVNAEGTGFSFAEILQSSPGQWVFIERIALGAGGQIYTFGDTPYFPVFPMANVIGNRGAGKLGPDGVVFRYLTPLPMQRGSDAGGTGDVAVDGQDRAVIVGVAGAEASATAGAYRDAFAGGSFDVFVMRLDTMPSLVEVSPASANVEGGTVITISGTNFTTGMSVVVGGVPAANVAVIDAATMTAVAPAHEAGLVGVTVTSPDGETASMADAFTYVAGPTITSITPNKGPANGSTTVEILGTGFAPGVGVTFDGAAAGVPFVSETRIVANTPGGGPGPADVRVFNPNGGSVTLAGGFTYLGAAPVIISVSPAAGGVDGGDRVWILGMNFQQGARLLMGTTEMSATSLTIQPTSVSFTTPAHEAGAVSLTVTNPDQQTATMANAFTFAAESISGTVRAAPSNMPLAGLFVRAYRSTGTGPALVSSVQTNTMGQYRFAGLADGVYYLQTSNSNQFQYVDELWNNIACPRQACSPETGTPVVVAGQAVSGVDFALDIGGAITGRVTDADTGSMISNFVYMTLYDTAGRAVASTNTSGLNGSFSFSGVSAGTYYVAAFGSSSGYQDQVYRSINCPVEGCSVTTGTGVPVVAGQTTSSVDFALRKGARISGNVREAGTNAAVLTSLELYNSAGARVKTASAGRYGSAFYSFGGIPNGTYFVKAVGATSGYVDQVYKDTPCAAGCAVTLGTRIDVTGPSTIAGIDLTLWKLATVSLDHLEQVYDGTPRAVSVSTAPVSLLVAFTYEGVGETHYARSDEPPVAAGTYTVTASVVSQFYQGRVTGTLTVLNTGTGTSVPVVPTDPVTHTQPVALTFGEVTSPGETTVVTAAAGPAPAGNFSLVGTYYEISTTATFSGPVIVCMAYPVPLPEGAVESELVLQHFVGGVWLALPVVSRDFAAHRICGWTTSFSPFAVFAPPAAPVVTIETPADGATFRMSETAPVHFSCATAAGTPLLCSAADEHGTAVASGGTLDTSAAGQHILTVSAQVGSVTTTTSAHYKVVYGVKALYDQAKAKSPGSTVPIRIRLEDAAGRDVSSAAIIVSATELVMISDQATSVVEDSGQANPDSNFRYDDGQYVFNLKTTGLGTGTYSVRFRAGLDPNVHSVEFQIR